MRFTLYFISCVIKSITKSRGPCCKLYFEKIKTERIKQNTLIGGIARNGLYRVDMSCELKLSKVAPITNSHKSKCIPFCYSE